MPQFSARIHAAGIYRPLVEVVLRAGRVRRRLTALVDSGADLSLIPAELLEDLMPFESLARAGQAAGVGIAEMRSADLTLTFGGTVFATRVLVVAPGTDLPFAVLGRDDFFRHFDVGFRWSQTPPTFSIEPAA